MGEEPMESLKFLGLNLIIAEGPTRIVSLPEGNFVRLPKDPPEFESSMKLNPDGQFDFLMIHRPGRLVLRKPGQMVILSDS